MTLLTIGELGKRAGTNVETIRFYERKGLVARPARSPSGYRLYQPDVVKRLRFIRRAKDMGFTLKEIAELLALRNEPGTSCADVRSRAAEKIATIEDKMAELQRMREALGALAAQCTGKGPLSECPILDAFESGDP